MSFSWSPSPDQEKNLSSVLFVSRAKRVVMNYLNWTPIKYFFKPINGTEDTMFIVHVFVHVKSDRIEDFKQSTLENARNSVLEPGIARFDVV